MKVYVGNIPKSMTEEQFTELVAPFGKAEPVAIVKDKITGEPRGFGFVEFKNDEEAKKAIAGLNGKEVGGQALRVNESQPKNSMKVRA